MLERNTVFRQTYLIATPVDILTFLGELSMHRITFLGIRRPITCSPVLNQLILESAWGNSLGEGRSCVAVRNNFWATSLVLNPTR